MQTTVEQLEHRIAVLEQVVRDTRENIWVFVSTNKHWVIITDGGTLQRDTFGQFYPFMETDNEASTIDLQTINQNYILTGGFSTNYEKISLKKYYQTILNRNKILLIKLQGNGAEEI